MNEVERLLDLASNYDKTARDYRKLAGVELAKARAMGKPKWRGTLDQRTAELLIGLAVGREL